MNPNIKPPFNPDDMFELSFLLTRAIVLMEDQKPDVVLRAIQRAIYWLESDYPSRRRIFSSYHCGSNLVQLIHCGPLRGGRHEIATESNSYAFTEYAQEALSRHSDFPDQRFRTDENGGATFSFLAEEIEEDVYEPKDTDFIVTLSDGRRFAF